MDAAVARLYGRANHYVGALWFYELVAQSGMCTLPER